MATIPSASICTNRGKFQIITDDDLLKFRHRKGIANPVTERVRYFAKLWINYVAGAASNDDDVLSVRMLFDKIAYREAALEIACPRFRLIGINTDH